ncbi:hypothetical protein B0H34DRAFT_796776 [Crassisporium funariophilum]|nr:hypothetical protein B0H34DRAFT_796776 [Crassisporium funariophilum]
MPLPPNTTLSLLGHSRPGDTMHSKPKQAMIIRMSVETLDALESIPGRPQLELEFGDNPGIYVGDTYFPMRHQQETTIHELYLRASSATKKTAPMKLYANVIGKFAVERELDDEVRDKIRESTQDAVNQRNTRTTMFIETPPDLPTNNKKRKKPPASIFQKPVRPIDKPRNTPVPPPIANPPNTNRTADVPPQPQREREGSVPLRKRMVHCLATSERTEDQVVRLVGGSDCSQSLRREIHDILDQVAEIAPAAKGSGDKSSKTYRLKPMAWKEVRPYEWPKLTESERTTMARTARLKLQDLGIPESDPLWNHMRFRTSATNSTSEPSRPSSSNITEAKAGPSTQDVPKRGVSSREVKEKKTKPKRDPKGEIMMKDESIRAPSRVSQMQDKPRDPAPVKKVQPAPNEVPAPRKPAGSSSKPLKTVAQRGDPEVSRGSPANMKPSNSRPGDAAYSSSTAKPLATQREEKTVPSQKIKKIRQEGASGAYDSDRDRRYPPSDREKVVKKEKVERTRVDDNAPLLKRKSNTRDDDEPYEPSSHSLSQKRRKTESMPAHASNSAAKDDNRPKAAPALKKTNLEPRPRPSLPPVASSSSTKRRDSPALNSKSAAQSTGKMSSDAHPSSNPHPSNNGSSKGSSRPSGSAKLRRRSPIYTSSEEDDDNENRPSTNRVSHSHSHTHSVASLPTPSTLSHSSSSPANSRTNPRSANVPRPLPTDHAAIRARYSSSYVDYLGSFQKVMVQKAKLEQLLKNTDKASGGSITDSDGDVELLDPEDLAHLAASHRKMHDELDSMRKVFLEKAD